MRFFALILSTAAVVAAHGYVDSATINGKAYQFYQPYSDPYMNPPPLRISRPIPNNGSVKDLDLIDVQCNGWTAGGVPGSKPAPLHADAAAGSTVNLKWTFWPQSHIGPAITYMARCPDTGCDNWQPGSSKVWFKVQEAGQVGAVYNWVTTPLSQPNNAGIDYTIPSCLKPGYYLVRHEIIALHFAYYYPGAEVYPSCHQLKVSGSGSTTPGNLVAFPGAYVGSDPGITYNAFPGSAYKIPGPALFKC